MKNQRPSATNSAFSIDEKTTKNIDGFFGSVGPKTKITNLDELRAKRLGELDNSSQTFFAIGEKARIEYWKVDLDRYTERFFLLSCPGLTQYINSYAKYLQEVHGIPKSSAHADIKVYKMLEPGTRREVLDKSIDMLNSYIRLFSSADTKWYEKLLADIEDLAKHSSDDLKSYFIAVKAADKKWHLKLLDDIDKIAEVSADKIAELGDKPNSNDVANAVKQSVTELVELYNTSDSNNTKDKQSDSDSTKETEKVA